VSDNEVKVSFSCFFCGLARDEEEPVTVAAIWTEDGKQREQYWGAHRSCMIEAMSDFTRKEFGGPFTGDE
jgi:hypothetical protein